MSKPNRLHKAAILFNFVKLVKEVFFGTIIGFLATFKNIDLGGFWFILLYVSLFIIGAAIISTLQWYRFTYVVEQDQLKIESGIFIKKKRTISFNRIQAIDVSEGIVHRVFKLAKVEVQTAGGDVTSKAEAVLSAISREKAYEWKELLQVKKEIEQELDEEPKEEIVKTISTPRLLLAASTTNGFGVFLSIVALVGSQFGQFIPNPIYEAVYGWMLNLSVPVLIIFSVIGALFLWGTATLGIWIKYSFFTIRKADDGLQLSHGLLEKKHLTLSTNRIQAISVREDLLRQWLGYATVHAEVVGGRLDAKDGGTSVLLFPLLKKTEVESFLEQFVPDYQPEVLQHVLPKRSRKRYLFRVLFPVVLAAIPILYFLPTYSWILIILLVLASLLGVFQYKDSGYTLAGDKLILSSRRISKSTVVMFRKRIQSLTISDHYLQQRESLKTLKCSVAAIGGVGKTFAYKDGDEDQIQELFSWYSFQEK
ncbi:PH domain-containing protein [Radiobacillus deserti]|nr:PH domain-containing protein [Radiobacillus deserti]